MTNNKPKPFTIGVLRETMVPNETRTPLTPNQCAKILAQYGDKVAIVVEKYPFRCYSDKEYEDLGIKLVEKAENVDLLLGVKAASIESLKDNSTYVMFSHTAKRQPQNRTLLRAILAKGIRLMDWEFMRDENKVRLIGFGRWAGIVGAHNTIAAWGKKTGRFDLFRLCKIADWEAAQRRYREELPIELLRGMRVVLTGSGRVGTGCREILDLLGFEKISPADLLARDWSSADHPPVYAQLPADHLFRLGPDNSWSPDYYANPTGYHSIAWPYMVKANILINGMYWDNRCGPLLTIEQMCQPEMAVRLIGDITCDIAPVASLPCTVRPTVVKDPVLTFDPELGRELQPGEPRSALAVDVMAVDNLPSELPRDASRDFGDMILNKVLPEFLQAAAADGNQRVSPVLEGATITEAGKLTSVFAYLSDFVNAAED
ncbi:hypothetical protein BOX15_Mlig019856g3 [Macrostomum lignano]|uniref:AlaDh_PNT_N domain-containing protein n=2 Tax=Macrostomum lignano TaxID=282301 RepID=A0A1I8GIX8_9PLAT|nr:hypothetical protein BOX15_Mlig019856g3 [Macrostomum lignano]